jgi:hypothetical protein
VPLRSGIDYLWAGGVWVGAVKGRDTLVSIGADGWNFNANEYYALPFPEGDVLERTNRPILRAEPNSACSDVFFSEDAVSEQDFVAVYYDTVTNPALVPTDQGRGRPHAPLGIEIKQESYSWSFDYAKDFILMDLNLRNISGELLKDLYMGIFMDQDVGHNGIGQPQVDDITGFANTVPSALAQGFLDTVNIAWSADNDGDPIGGRFDSRSPTRAAGVRIVRTPGERLRFSFNWYVTNSNVALDWGPNKQTMPIDFHLGNLGTPVGDIAKYQMLSNGEFDYNQIESALDHQVDGWLPPVNNPQLASNLADGFDTRYLLSFGPFDVFPDSTLNMTIAFVSGEDFHTDPRNFQAFYDPGRPEAFTERLDFTDLARNAQWAGWVFDTPGFDTDGDGNRGRYWIVDGDTVFYQGDGVPDFSGPPPPPSPSLRFTTFEGRIVMRWNGRNSETTRDNFSNVADFEGYRVYMGRTGRLDDFALLSQRDNINYLRLKWNPSRQRWLVKDRPFTLDSLQILYNDLVDSLYGYTPFHPDSFKVRLTSEALMEVVLDDIDPSKLDTNLYVFERNDANDKVNDTTAHWADSAGMQVLRVIRKRFPFATPADTIFENGVPYNAFYEYEYALDGLQLAEPVWLAVTAFDFGDPVAGLDPLESSPLANTQEVWPINAAEVVKSSRPKPGVYPNPYRLADRYNDDGWEDPARLGLDPERARKITFTNVPDTCTVSIWSLDGDLVRRLDHAENPLSSEATVVVWNIITRNTQAVKTGLYLYTIESRFGTDIGKLVIIK